MIKKGVIISLLVLVLVFPLVNSSDFVNDDLNVPILRRTTSSDTLGGLSCSNAQIAKWNATSNQWECEQDETGAGAGITWEQVTNGTMTELTTLLGFSYYNATDFDINDYLTQASWNANYTANNDAWLLDTNTYNTSSDIWTVVDNATFAYIDEPLWTANFTLYNASWSADTDTNTNCSVIGSCDDIVYVGEATEGDINVSDGNITIGQDFFLCLNVACSRYIYDNGTGVVIVG